MIFDKKRQKISHTQKLIIWKKFYANSIKLSLPSTFFAQKGSPFFLIFINTFGYFVQCHSFN